MTLTMTLLCMYKKLFAKLKIRTAGPTFPRTLNRPLAQPENRLAEKTMRALQAANKQQQQQQVVCDRQALRLRPWTGFQGLSAESKYAKRGLISRPFKGNSRAERSGAKTLRFFCRALQHWQPHRRRGEQHDQRRP